MNRRISTLAVAMAPIVVFGVLMAAVPVPYVALGPGPTFDTLGEVEGKQVVAVEGTPVKPPVGHLNMTTVSQKDGLTLGQAMAFWASGDEQLVPRDLVFPPEKSRDDIKSAQTADFQRSEDNAEYAALNYLKYPTAVTAEKINDPGPSVGKLQAGDAVEAVNGTKVTEIEAFTKLLKATKPGDEITVDYRRRNNTTGTARITLGRNEDRDHGYLGIAVRDA
ncbi:MAG: PDZ domain-containing protein, partial [Mycobacterium sp.]|nr:PDZ domain-containing protein [Mycobacterium sp.]